MDAKIASPVKAPDWFHTRRGRAVLEHLTAYLFLAPAGTIIFLFGIFPVAFAFYVSFHRWRRFPDNHVGIDQYTRALDQLAYVLFFWLALAAFVFAAVSLWRFWRGTEGKRRGLTLVLPGLFNALSGMLFIHWFFILVPLVLDIPQRIRGQERVQGLFVRELTITLGDPAVTEAWGWWVMIALTGLVLSIALIRLVALDDGWTLLGRVSAGWMALMIGGWLLLFTVTEMNAAVAAAQAAETPLPIWTQIVLISAGAALLVAAFVLWIRAPKHMDDRRALVQLVAALMLAVGGYILVAELPLMLANADSAMLKGYGVTILFVLGTVPFQLAIGLVLAYLLFQNIRGKSFFRIIYFLPYITPFVATSIVFKLLFSHRPTSAANSVMTFLGIPPQNWLLEQRGIFELMFGEGVPDALAGPSLALLVIMLYTVWTYIGYDTVIFLAGLVNIPGELYEAARIDGASDWSLFRHITLPLLSPTTFFLSLIAIIGTFQAFTQVWIMRSPAASSSVDTVSVYIFETVRSNDPNMGYGSAMSIVLFVIILLMTLVQNRIAERNVFYG